MPHKVPDDQYLWIGDFISTNTNDYKINGTLELMLPIDFFDNIIQYEDIYIGYIYFKGDYLKDCRYLVNINIIAETDQIIIKIIHNDQIIILTVLKSTHDKNNKDVKIIGTYASDNPYDVGDFYLYPTLIRKISSSEIIKL